MIQVYSDGVAVAAGGTYPLNTAVFNKGNTASQNAVGSVGINTRGVYNVHVDGFATLAAAGVYSIQLTRNGIPLPQAISSMNVAAGEIGSGSFETVIVVEEGNCPCDWTSAATSIGVINPSEADVTDAHINVLVSKVI